MDFEKFAKTLELIITDQGNIILQKEGDEVVVLCGGFGNSVSIVGQDLSEEIPLGSGYINISFDNISYFICDEESKKIIFEYISEDIINLLEVDSRGHFSLLCGLDPQTYDPKWVEQRVKV